MNRSQNTFSSTEDPNRDSRTQNSRAGPKNKTYLSNKDINKNYNKTNKYDHRFDTRTICIPLIGEEEEEKRGERRRRRIEFNSFQ